MIFPCFFVDFLAKGCQKVWQDVNIYRILLESLKEKNNNFAVYLRHIISTGPYMNHKLSILTCGLLVFLWSEALLAHDRIDREELVKRNNPIVTRIDSLSSLTVGNGGFAMTVDATGLQTFPELYAKGVCLGTMSDWGWHSFANPNHYKVEEILAVKNFGRGHDELYAAQFKQPERLRKATEWLRANPHRLHLGVVGLNLDDADKVKDIHQILDMWTGMVTSNFRYGKIRYEVRTLCSPTTDRIAASVKSTEAPSIRLCFPYPTGGHSDDACDWQSDDKHTTTVAQQGVQYVVLKRQLDDTQYYVTVTWTGKARIMKQGANRFLLKSGGKSLEFSVTFSPVAPSTVTAQSFNADMVETANYWKAFWSKGGAVDFSAVKDARARELERRVVLSQYLMAVNDAGTTPPQETGLVYNSWFGKFHLEMTWWHLAHFALWGHPEKLEKSLSWYLQVMPKAAEIARRQGFEGVRWMKMTDPSGAEAPSNVGSYLIWQQPHIIYLAELLYRAEKDETARARLLSKYGDAIDETARFMCSFASYDSIHHRYVLKGCIPAQETLKASETVNPPFELSYWHWAIQVAQQWRERRGLARQSEWDDVVAKLSPLAANSDSLYLAAESATNTYTDIRYTSDHMAVLGALGVLPECSLVNKSIMRNTLHWVLKNWNWNKTWGWDYPMTAMCAVRLGEPEKAVEALLMNRRTNTYLISGHNYQDGRLRIYLPGNGGLLTTVALMCAGWDTAGTPMRNPGFPKGWDVKWENIQPLP